MNKRILSSLVLVGLAIPLLPAAEANYGAGFQPGPCEPSGKVFVLAQTDYVTIPSDGYSWNGRNPDTHGGRGNVTLWAYNLDVAGGCLGIVYPETGTGPYDACPPAGRTPAWYTTTVYRPAGTHWDSQGRLWLDGSYDTYAVGGQNNGFAGKCYGTAYAEQIRTQPVSQCLNCVSHDDDGPALLP